MLLKGQKEYKKFQEGKGLTRKQVILAQCYACNGEEEGGFDCQSKASCPLYQYFPYKGKKDLKIESENGTFKGNRNKEKEG